MTIGVGFTVIVKLCVGPAQFTWLPVNIGVTVTDELTGILVLFKAAKLPILPVPDPNNPIEVKVFDQE